MNTCIKCDKCKSLETEYGFEFYFPQKNPCKISQYCPICRYSQDIDSSHTCEKPLYMHEMKTKFSLQYQKSYDEEKLKFEKQMIIRNKVKEKWVKIKTDDPIEKSYFLELLEDAIQAHLNDNTLEIEQTKKQLENLERDIRNRKQVDEERILSSPKEIKCERRNNFEKNKDQFVLQEKLFYERKFKRYLLSK